MINGRLPAASLVVVQGSERLVPAAAAAWRALVEAAARDRVAVWITVGGSYRDLKAQRRLFQVGSASGIRVAEPGYQTHGWGDRVDVGSFGQGFGLAGRTRERWLLANAARFGFTREFGAADPNHFKHTEETRMGQRITKTAAKRRTTPTAADESNVSGDPLPAGTTVEVAGYRTDLNPKKLIGKTNKWFLVGKLYSHASTFTDPSTTGLTDLDVKAAVTLAEVEATVKASEARIIAAFPKPPTAADVAAEVIRQQKLPGN